MPRRALWEQLPRWILGWAVGIPAVGLAIVAAGLLLAGGGVHWLAARMARWGDWLEG